MPDKKSIKLPKSPAALADLLFNTREARYKLQKEVDKLQEIETAVKNWFVDNLPKSQASGIAGRVARIQLEKKSVPQVQDWDKFYAFVRKEKNGFALLQRRLSEGAVKERLEAGERLPGVGTFTAITVSCTKLKGGE